MSAYNLPPIHYIHRDMILTQRQPKEHVDRVLDSFQFKESDIVLVTYPRSGTLLTQEIIWHIKNKNIIRAGESYPPMAERFPYLEINVPRHGRTNSVDFLESQSNNEYRLIKTHLPQYAIYDKIKHCKKIIVIYRDAKDVASSLFNFYKSFPDYNGWPQSWDEFFDHFVNGKVMYGSYFVWNSGWLAKRDSPNIHFIKYENMANDKASEIRRIAVFLNESDITDDQIDIIMKNTSVQSMSSNSNVNLLLDKGQTIIRKGIVGDWKNYMNKDQEELVDSLTEKYIKPFE